MGLGCGCQSLRKDFPGNQLPGLGEDAVASGWPRVWAGTAPAGPGGWRVAAPGPDNLWGQASGRLWASAPGSLPAGGWGSSLGMPPWTYSQGWDVCLCVRVCVCARTRAGTDPGMEALPHARPLALCGAQTCPPWGSAPPSLHSGVSWAPDPSPTLEKQQLCVSCSCDQCNYNVSV